MIRHYLCVHLSSHKYHPILCIKKDDDFLRDMFIVKKKKKTKMYYKIEVEIFVAVVQRFFTVRLPVAFIALSPVTRPRRSASGAALVAKLGTTKLSPVLVGDGMANGALLVTVFFISKQVHKEKQIKHVHSCKESLFHRRLP